MVQFLVTQGLFTRTTLADQSPGHALKKTVRKVKVQAAPRRHAKERSRELQPSP